MQMNGPKTSASSNAQVAFPRPSMSVILDQLRTMQAEAREASQNIPVLATVTR
jgi:hypothetical protein